MVWVYIIQSVQDKGYYIGITKDTKVRLNSHNAGKVRSTKKRKPFILLYTEKFLNYNEARTREIEIKSYKGGNELRKLIS